MPNGMMEYTLSHDERSSILSHVEKQYETDMSPSNTVSCTPDGKLSILPTNKEFLEMIKDGDIDDIKEAVENGYDFKSYFGLPVSGGPTLCKIAFFENQFEIFKFFLDLTEQDYMNHVASEIALYPGSITYLRPIIDRLGLFDPAMLRLASTPRRYVSLIENLKFLSAYGADLSYLFSIFSTPVDIGLLTTFGADPNKAVIGLNSKFGFGSVDELISMDELYSRGYEYMSKFHSSGLSHEEWNEARLMLMI